MRARERYSEQCTAAAVPLLSVLFTTQRRPRVKGVKTPDSLHGEFSVGAERENSIRRTPINGGCAAAPNELRRGDRTVGLPFEAEGQHVSTATSRTQLPFV